MSTGEPGDDLAALVRSFESISSRDDAEAFAVRHWLSRAGVDQRFGKGYLGVWRGAFSGQAVSMSLRKYADIRLVDPHLRVFEAVLKVDGVLVARVQYDAAQ